jgi:hypothetical protein
MPFLHQLRLPPLNGAPVSARLDSWRQEPSAFLERGDPIANISIDGTAYNLSVDFPCTLSRLIAQPGDRVNTGDVIAACETELEYREDHRESLVIQPKLFESFPSVVRYAAACGWCVSPWCTTCGNGQFRSALNSLDGGFGERLTHELSNMSLEDYVKIPIWKEALEIVFICSLPSPGQRERILLAWLSQSDVPDRFVDVVLYHFAPHCRDPVLRQRWISESIALAIPNRDGSLTESLLWKLGSGVIAEPRLLNLAFELCETYTPIRKPLAMSLASGAVLATSYAFRTQASGGLRGPVSFEFSEFRADSTARAKRDVTSFTVSQRTRDHKWIPIWSISGKALDATAIVYGVVPPNWNTITPPQRRLLAGRLYAAFALDERGGSSGVYFRFDADGKMTFPDLPE